LEREQAPAPERRPPRRLGRLVWRPAFAYGLVAVFAAFALVMAASPSARSAVLEFLGLKSARIERREPTATPRAAAPLGSDLGLGTRTSLAKVRRTVGFPVGVPSTLGAPDVVYLDTLPTAGDAVHLIYSERSTGIPTSSNTGAALLISQFPATVEPLIEKAIGGAGRVARLTIDGDRAYFLEGAHGFAFSDAKGAGADYEEQRLAGNTLLVERGGILIRVEGEISQRDAIGLVRSLEG
jgi:hypothetical protein